MVQPSLSDLADKYTILKLKCEHGLDAQTELAELEPHATEVDPELLQELYEANAAQWRLEELIQEQTNFELIGCLYWSLRWSNQRRIRVKNKINERYGHPLEVKSY